MAQKKYTKRFIAQGLLIALTITFGLNTVFAAVEKQWPNTGSPAPQLINNDAGNTYNDTNPQVVQDKADGDFVVVWVDTRNGNRDIYAQKMSATDGSDQWNSNDVVVTNAAGDQPEKMVFNNKHFEIRNDSNGTFIVWDSSNGPPPVDTFIQRLDSNGTPAWTANGVQLSSDPTPSTAIEAGPRMVLDGSGGAFIAWTALQNPSTSTSTVYVAHINTSGTVDAGPLALPAGANSLNIAESIISDAAGGVIVTYGSLSNPVAGETLALRLNSSLTAVAGWNSGNPVVVTDGGDSASINGAMSMSDGSGGVIITYRDTSNDTLKIQRLDSSGVEQWNGGTSTTLAAGQSLYGNFDIAPDGAGGAVVTWDDDRGASTNVYAQKVNSSGALQWATNGVPVSDTSGFNNTLGSNPGVRTVKGSTIIGYTKAERDIILQKLDSSGAKQYGTKGLTLSQFPAPFGTSATPPYINTDNNQGAVAVWAQDDGTSNADIYAQYVADPPAGAAPDAIIDLSATGGNGDASLNWTAPNDNGFPITAYVVEYGIGAFDQTCTDLSCTDATPGATVPGLNNFSNYQFRVSATSTIGTGAVSNTAETIPNPCAPLAFNDDSGGPTVSESCLGVIINAGTISIEDIPDTFSFPTKFSSTQAQDSFNNDNAATSTIDVTTGAGDILTIADLRNAGGFDVTITSSLIQESLGLDTIPLENLHIATSCPDGDDLAADLYGSPNNCDNTNGAEFADGSSNIANMNQANTVHSDNATGTVTNATELTTLRNAYLNDGQSFDENTDLTADIILLMESTAPRLARLSQALNLYLNIPANPTPGTYNIKFTIDLIPN